MADYSGHIDSWGYSLTSAWIRRASDSDWDSTWPPGIWGTFKDFSSGGAKTQAKILGFLIDGHNYGMARAWERERIIDTTPPRITWNHRYKYWEQNGGYRFDNEGGIEWLIRHGYLRRNNGKLEILKDF